ncbi:hypothetical protein [Actinomadura miaoliensis]|uniref:Uncharacterized protein n=1 Tax=Actinomadura miaoliensis TaxID=430685 RepID=A0ABP7WZV8_9ACTN
MTTTTSASPVRSVRHYHVSEFTLGCLPEAEPYVTDDPALAVDALASLLEGRDETADPSDAVQAAERAAIYQSQRSGFHGGHDGALAHLEQGQEVCEIVALRAFEIAVCDDRDCLRYCPSHKCRTVVPVTDFDPWCWCCGTAYVPADACPWLD